MLQNVQPTELGHKNDDMEAVEGEVSTFMTARPSSQPAALQHKHCNTIPLQCCSLLIVLFFGYAILPLPVHLRNLCDSMGDEFSRKWGLAQIHAVMDCAFATTSEPHYTKPWGARQMIANMTSDVNGNLNAFSNDKAVCSIGGYHLFHFPHDMERLYRCWSWWQLHPNAKHVLCHDDNYSGNASGFVAGVGSRVTRGVLTAFAQSNVSIMRCSALTQADREMAVAPFISGHDGNPASVLLHTVGFLQDIMSLNWLGASWAMKGHSLDTSRRVPPFRSGDQWFHSPSHAAALRTLVLGMLKMRPREIHEVWPKIGILNRHSRGIINAATLIRQLQQYGHVTETNFDGESFLDQVRFMHSHDLLISPHGAQLTLLPFMTECSGVLEIFPRGYFMPYFFGNLAVDSGLIHMWLYMSGADAEDEADEILPWGSSRGVARSVGMCPAPSRVLIAIRRLLKDHFGCVGNKT